MLVGGTGVMQVVGIVLALRQWLDRQAGRPDLGVRASLLAPTATTTARCPKASRATAVAATCSSFPPACSESAAALMPEATPSTAGAAAGLARIVAAHTASPAVTAATILRSLSGI